MFQYNLEIIKHSLGDACTHLSPLMTKKFDKDLEKYVPMYGVKAVIINEEGGRDKVEVGFSKHFDSFTKEDFQAIFEHLNTRDYNGRKDTV